MKNLKKAWEKFWKIEAIGLRIAVAIICFGVLAMIIWRKLGENDISTNGIVVEAIITEYLTPAKGSAKASYRCEFQFQGKKKSLVSASSIEYRRSSYVGMKYRALYSKKYDRVRLLMTSQDSIDFLPASGF